MQCEVVRERSLFFPQDDSQRFVVSDHLTPSTSDDPSFYLSVFALNELLSVKNMIALHQYLG